MGDGDGARVLKCGWRMIRVTLCCIASFRDFKMWPAGKSKRFSEDTLILSVAEGMQESKILAVGLVYHFVKMILLETPRCEILQHPNSS